MGGINHTLNIGAEALYTSRQGVDTSSHNIANAHTEGFSRQNVNAVSRDPNQGRGGNIIGNGVFVKNITRSHDKFLEKQINMANGALGSSEGKFEALQGLETIFSPELSASVADEMSSFFNALQTLSNSPEEIGARTAFREAANSLITSFKRVDESVRNERANLNSKIITVAEDVTNKLRRVAELNLAIGDMETGRPDFVANDLRDEQERLVREVSKEINIRYYTNRDGLLVVRGPKDSLLVEGKFASSIETKPGPNDASAHRLVVVDHERSRVDDITDNITEGRVTSFLEVRDKIANRLLSKNEELAKSFTGSFNTVHRRGYGANEYRENSGRDFFMANDAPGDFVRTLSLSNPVQDSIDAISIGSTPNSAGDNVIGNELLRLKDTPLLNDQNASFHQFYADFVGQLGVEVVGSRHRKEADEVVIGDLTARREAVAGVSLDEEAVNLMKWQANFTASSKVITTADEMLETVLNLKR
jgi:flagellar hook-associated protein 1 FlgK